MITKNITDRSGSPWYNEEVLSAKREKRKAERKYRKSKLTVHLDILRDARRRVNQLSREAKSLYYRSKIEDCAGDQRALFRLTNELMHRERNTQLPAFEDPLTLANDFVQYFVDKIERISRGFGDTESKSDQRHESNVPEITLHPVSEEELKKVILGGNSKSCHLDPIPTTLLKECVSVLLPVLTNIVNKSIQGSTFPQLFKFATLIPLLKKPSLDKEQHRNFRPVSNLAYVGKLIEKVVVDQMNSHREEHGLHSEFQSAYRKCHSTETALVRIVNDILLEMDQKKCVALVMLDLSAAFDTVSHDILLQSLEEDFGV